MAWGTIPLPVTGTVIAASWGAQVKADMEETAAAKFTTAGDLFVGTGANAGARLALGATNMPLLAGSGTPAWAFDPEANVSWSVGRRTSANPGVPFSLVAGGAPIGGTNRDGGALRLFGGISTGNTGSKIEFATASVGASGTSDNTPTVKWEMSPSGTLVPIVGDNAIDIGSSGVRVRTIYLATSLALGTDPASSGAIRLANTSVIQARNAGNTGNIPLISLFGDQIYIGTTSVGNVRLQDTLSIGLNEASAGDIRLRNNAAINWRNAAGSGDVSALIVDTADNLKTGAAAFVPVVHNAQDLGTTGVRWRDAWVQRAAFNGSSRTLKRDLSPLDPAAALEAVRATEVVAFRYLPTDETDAGAEQWHVGFVAEDAPDLLSPDHATASPGSTAGVALAAIQALAAEVADLKAQLASALALLTERAPSAGAQGA